MKFLSIVIFSCLAFSSVHAASELSTDFEELGEMFDQGTLPTKEETFGWWSGRCYRGGEPSKPTAGLLTYRVIIHPDNRNDFPPRTAQQMIFVSSTGTPPANYYDNNLSEFKNGVKKLTRMFDNEVFTTKEQESSLVSADKYTHYSLKKYGDYFVGQIIYLNTHTVIANCYYFKKVY